MVDEAGAGIARERCGDLDGGDATGRADDERGERRAVARPAPELDERVSAGEAEETEGQQVRVRRADRREAFVVERERNVVEAPRFVTGPDEARAVHRFDRFEMGWIEWAEL